MVRLASLSGEEIKMTQEEGRPHVDTGRRWPSTSPGEASEETTLSASGSWTSGFQDCEENKPLLFEQPSL